MTWYLYIIQTEGNTLYTGISTDYERRFLEHLSGVGGAKFFRRSPPQKIVYLESHNNRSEASKAESYIKSLSPRQKRSLINKYFPDILN
jgi:putative endonuclease